MKWSSALYGISGLFFRSNRLWAHACPMRRHCLVRHLLQFLPRGIRGDRGGRRAAIAAGSRGRGLLMCLRSSKSTQGVSACRASALALGAGRGHRAEEGAASRPRCEERIFEDRGVRWRGAFAIGYWPVTLWAPPDCERVTLARDSVRFGSRRAFVLRALSPNRRLRDDVGRGAHAIQGRPGTSRTSPSAPPSGKPTHALPGEGRVHRLSGGLCDRCWPADEPGPAPSRISKPCARVAGQRGRRRAFSLGSGRRTKSRARY
jgi:hypothetical protein